MKHNPPRVRRHLRSSPHFNAKARFDSTKATEARRRAKWLNPDKLPPEQALLWRACNSRRVNLRLFDKSMRMGAKISEPVEASAGSLALHCFCEISDSPIHAQKLLEKGASLNDTDKHGRNCAHYAVSNMNAAMTDWLWTNAADLFAKTCSKGLTPLLESFGDGSFAWLFSDDSAQFRQRIFDRLTPDAQIAFKKSAFAIACSRLACSIVPTYEDDLAWLFKIGAQIPSRRELATTLDASKAALYHKDLLAAMEPYFSQLEQSELSMAIPSLDQGPPRAKSL